MSLHDNTYNITCGLLKSSSLVPKYIRRMSTVRVTKAISRIQDKLMCFTEDGGCVLLMGDVGVGKTVALYYGLAWLRATQIELTVSRAAQSHERAEWRDRALAMGKPQEPQKDADYGPMGSYKMAMVMYRKEEELWQSAHKPLTDFDDAPLMAQLQAERWEPLVRRAQDVVELDSIEDQLNGHFWERPEPLGIDDMGVEHWRPAEGMSGSSWGMMRWDELIDYRYSHMLPTIITTNLGPETITERYGDRIYDRFKGWASTVAIRDKSMRGE